MTKGATVMVMDRKGGMRTPEQGSYGFACIPDDAGTPGAAATYVY